MHRKRKSYSGKVLLAMWGLLIVLIAACQTIPTITPVDVTQTSTLMETPGGTSLLPTRITTFTATPTNLPLLARESEVPFSLPPTSTSIPSLTPFPTRAPKQTAISLPSLERTPISFGGAVISPDNADDVIQLGTLGTGKILEVKYSSDGELLAVETTAGQYIYNSRDFEQASFEESVWNSIVPSDGQDVALIWNLGGYQLWRDGDLIADLGSTGVINLSGDFSRVAAANSLGEVDIWETEAGELTNTIRVEKDGTRCGSIRLIALSHDGSVLAANCTIDGAIYIWRAENGELVGKIEPERTPVNAILFSPDGSILAVSSKGMIGLWQVSGGDLIHELEDPQHGSYEDVKLAFSPNGETIVGGFENGGVMVWDVGSGELVSRLHNSVPSGETLAFSPDSRFLASPAYNDLIVWDLARGRVSHRLEGIPYSESITSTLNNEGFLEESILGVIDVEFSPDGNYISSLRDTGLLDVWDMPNGTLRKQLIASCCNISFTADGFGLAYGISEWELRFVQLGLWEPYHDVHSPVIFYRHALSPDDEKVAVGADKLNLLWVEDGFQIFELSDGAVTSIAFSPDNQWLGAAIGDRVQLWNIENGESQTGFSTHDNAFVFSPGGQILATGGVGGLIRLWLLQDGSLLQELGSSGQQVSSLLFSPDGKLLVSAGEKGIVNLWGVQTQVGTNPH